MTPSDYQKIWKTLDEAKQNARPVPQMTSQFSDFSVREAYQIQALGLEESLGRGEKLVGYKMGLTSKAKQRDVGVFEPIRGYLLAKFEFQKGDTLTTHDRIHPRVEPEVAVILKKPLKGPGVTLRDVENALERVCPALEIVDSRYENFKFNLADVVADNTSASAFLVGRENYLNRLDDLNLLGIIVKKNGTIVETGAPAAVLGDPLLSVVALANALGAEGRAIEPGMVILTGGITNSVPLTKGDSIEISWPGETLQFGVA